MSVSNMASEEKEGEKGEGEARCAAAAAAVGPVLDDCALSRQAHCVVSDPLGHVPAWVRGRGLLYQTEPGGRWHVVGGGHDRASMGSPYRAYYLGDLDSDALLCRRCYFGDPEDESPSASCFPCCEQ